LIVGRTIAECRELTAADLIAALDGVTPDKWDRPALAIAALRDALAGHHERDSAERLDCARAIRGAATPAEPRA
jgi:hypothetical protein